jgi:hypothetical protein
MNGLPHPNGPFRGVISGTSDTSGSKIDTTDKIAGGPFYSTLIIPFSVGTFSWLIPWIFKVGMGAEKQFTLVLHYMVIDAVGNMFITKGGTAESKNYADPDSSY